jgi:tRNA dimethylallyltransferase
MMYLSWLVHGRPDAIRPTDAAVQRAANIIHRFQSESTSINGTFNKKEETSEELDAAEELRWTHASQFVASLGPVFASRVAKLCGKDWYRLRRLLEVAYTMVESKVKSSEENSSNASQEEEILQSLNDAEVYTGIRSGSLSDAGFDVRCFFLCPTERMQHFHTVDYRCEEMLVRGLLQETAELYRSGGLPDDSQVTRAIGYRQALEYLLRTDAKMNDTDAFLSFVDDFATATRQYAKKQMQWFRKDPEFAFIPVDMQCNKSERVDQAAEYVSNDARTI